MATIPDKVNTGALATIVAVGAISMVGISAALTAMVRSEVDSHAEAVGAKSNLGPVRELKKSQLDELNQPARRDQATGRAMIPVERAMELVVQDLRQHPEHATEPAPPDAGKHEEADAGAAPATADGASAGEADAGAAPAPEPPAPGHEAPAPGHEAPTPGQEAPPTPAPEPPTGAAPPSGEHSAVPGSPSPAPAKKKKPAAHAPAPPPAAPPNSP